MLKMKHEKCTIPIVIGSATKGRDPIFKCSVCGKRSKSNHAHHKKQKSICPSMAYTVSNGTVLCPKHHTALHKKIGFGKHSYNEVKSWGKGGKYKKRPSRRRRKRTAASGGKITPKKNYHFKIIPRGRRCRRR